MRQKEATNRAESEPRRSKWEEAADVVNRWVDSPATSFADVRVLDELQSDISTSDQLPAGDEDDDASFFH
ncbi:unnamed protein product [Sphagnum jensenii]|uniref:Uncharacterized protein n=1 Tax=Sphagnum jensenii TaxID=128206 RepID=A0ABP1BYD3_9BRYO